MLNIGKMGPHSRRYYCDQVARSTSDYYLGKGEAPGRWTGNGVRALGLSGVVTSAQLDAVLAGEHPATGDALSSHPARTVPGFDLAFRAPKSVSLLWGLADQQTAAVVVEAHDRAVAAAIGYLETLARTRRGAGGVERVGVDGFVAAAFRHRTSRAEDPLLHTHVLVANVVRTSDDGKWRTLDAAVIYRAAKTAGMLYQAQLRHELTVRLGVAWGPVANGCADLAGVDRTFIEEFSQRRKEILHTLLARGETSANAAQIATLDTRAPKNVQADERTLRARWRDRAARLGIRNGWWRPLLHRTVPTRPDSAALYGELIGSEGLTKHASAFRRGDIIQAVCNRLPSGAPVGEVVTFAERVLEVGYDRNDIDQLSWWLPSDGPDEDALHTTTELVATEARALSRTLKRPPAANATLPSRLVEHELDERPSLSREQAAMVRRLVGDSAPVQVVVGRAGTGKTYALDAVRDIYETYKIRITGVTLAARAGIELEQTAGIETSTVASLLARLDRPGPSPLQQGQVLVVDEAGMVGTRQLARLLDHTARLDVKTILVGDPYQLPAVEAGGLFTALVDELDPTVLSDNRRQTQRWEIEALDHLRTGNIDHALDAYRQHERIVTADTADHIRTRLVDDWWHHVADDPGRDDVLMVALRRADVDDLNQRARARMKAAGHLTGPTLEVGGRQFQAGDRIVCLRNRPRAGVANGTRGTITRIRSDGGVEIRTDHGGLTLLRADYLDAGHLDHGYAITGHRAQGATVNHTLVLGSEALYREWGYVAMSRGRQTNRLYVHERAAQIEGGPHTRAEPGRSLGRLLDQRRQDQSLTRQIAADRERDRPLARSRAIRR